jgi:ABC-type polysaccharide/polyol phosphate export permease
MSAVATREEKAPPALAVTAATGHIHVIQPWRTGVTHRLWEIWEFRRLLPYFGKCYLLRKVRNTWLGWIWIPLRPGIDLISKTLFFHAALGAPSGDRPYFIFIAFGQSGWVVFHSVNQWATRSMRMSDKFLKGAYTPRLSRLTAVLVPAALDFLLNIAVAVVAIFVYWFTRGTLYLVPSFQVLMGFSGILLLAVWGLALGLVTSPWSAYTRDIRYTFGYVTQFWFFVTPVAYPLSHLHGALHKVAEFNPITAPVLLVQWGFLDTAPPPAISLITCFGSLFVLLFIGLWSFNRFERAAVSRL